MSECVSLAQSWQNKIPHAKQNILSTGLLLTDVWHPSHVFLFLHSLHMYMRFGKRMNSLNFFLVIFAQEIWNQLVQ